MLGSIEGLVFPEQDPRVGRSEQGGEGSAQKALTPGQVQPGQGRTQVFRRNAIL
jgi:hypothetical protein